MARNNRSSKSETVVAARFSALGDVAMTLPSLYNAAMANPGLRFVYFTRKGFAPIFIDPPVNLTVVGIDLERYKGVGGMWRLFRLMRDTYGMTCFVDLHDVLRTKMIRFFCRLYRIPVSMVDKGRDEKQALTRRNLKILTPLRPMTERYADAFEKAGIATGDMFCGLFNGRPAPAALIEAITPPRESTDERWIGIAPFAKHRGKIYPPELMENVVEQLTADPRVKVFLFGGGKEEAEILSRWESSYPRVVSLAGRKLGFATELAMLSSLDVVLSMDSGNMHLASLVGRPVVSVWGATHPYCGFSGWRQDSENVIQLPMPCRPCSVFGDKPCMRGDYHCLTAIPPALIAEKVRSLAEKSHLKND